MKLQTTKEVYDKAADKLELLLIKKHIAYVREKLFDGWKFTFPDLQGEKECIDSPDVIIHSFSYGGPSGLFESYHFLLDEGDVTGYMSVNDVLHHIEYEFQYLNQERRE